MTEDLAEVAEYTQPDTLCGENLQPADVTGAFMWLRPGTPAT
jgi:hypothetical protein